MRVDRRIPKEIANLRLRNGSRFWLILLGLLLLLLDTGTLCRDTDTEHVRVLSVELSEDDLFGLLAGFVVHNEGFFLDEGHSVLPQQLPAQVFRLPVGCYLGVDPSDLQLIFSWALIFIIPIRLNLLKMLL